MTKNSNIKNSEESYKPLAPSFRLKLVIMQYFKQQKILSAKSGIPSDTLSKYVTGRLDISENTAMQLQDLAGINADFLINGNLPMMLEGVEIETPYVVKYPGPPPIPNSYKEYDATETTRGIMPYSVLDVQGRRDILLAQGRYNIADIAVNGIEQGHSITIQIPQFIEKYKSIFPLKLNCYIILNKNYNVGDDVFVSIDDIAYLATYENNNTFIDCATDKEIPIQDKRKTIIIGSYFSSIVRGRIKIK